MCMYINKYFVYTVIYICICRQGQQSESEHFGNSVRLHDYWSQSKLIGFQALHGKHVPGLVAEIAADYTKDVIEKVQSRAASDRRFEHA